MEENIHVKQTDPSPFLLNGNGDIAVLLIHGFGGTPREMSRIGHYLHSQDITVHAPLLPGHGSTLAEMNRYSWHDWTAATLEAYDALAQTCQQAFIAGFSMGTLLALWLAIQQVPVSGLILYSPAVKVADWRIALTPLARYFIKSISKHRASDLRDATAQSLLGGFSRYPVPAAGELYRMQRYVRRRLFRITAPASVIYSVYDRSIHPRSGELTVRHLSNVVPVELMVLYGSGHSVVVDAEWEKVAEETLRFISRW